MLNRSASLGMSTSILKALPGKLDIKRHSPSILYLFAGSMCMVEPYPEGRGRVWRWRGRRQRGSRDSWTWGRPPTSDTSIRRCGIQQYSSMVHKTIIKLDPSVLYSCSSLKLVAWCSCFCHWEVSTHPLMPNRSFQFILFIPWQSQIDIVLASSVRPSGTISQYLLVRFDAFLL